MARGERVQVEQIQGIRNDRAGAFRGYLLTGQQSYASQMDADSGDLTALWPAPVRPCRAGPGCRCAALGQVRRVARVCGGDKSSGVAIAWMSPAKEMCVMGGWLARLRA